MTEDDLASERIERAALVSLHDHCPAETQEALGLFLEPVDGALVAGAEHDASILLNRALGLGVRQPLRAGAVADVASIYQRHGVSRYFLHLYAEDLTDAAAAALTAGGLAPARGWMKFRRGVRSAPTVSTELHIERAGPERATDFGRVVCEAFGMTDAAIPLLGGLTADPRWRCFVSYDLTEPAGAGALMVDSGVGFLEWGATRPAFRRRGSQGAIMAWRIQAAIDAGCTALYTETGEQVEGDPQHSYRNIQRYGFAEGRLRGNWAPSGTEG